MRARGDLAFHLPRHRQPKHAEFGARVPRVVLPRRHPVLLEHAVAARPSARRSSSIFGYPEANGRHLFFRYPFGETRTPIA